MAGGLLNIISTGNNNVFLTGNPSKSFFKVVYSQYTNFGLQKFRIDYDGQRDLRTSESSVFSFKIPRYAELLMDTYLVITLPDVWSPIYPPKSLTGIITEGVDKWSPYDFRWIRNIGTHIIQELTITCGTFTLQKYSGQYLAALVDRDFTTEKKNLFNEMTGNIPELYDPANAFGRINTYPSAFYSDATTGAEPSIRGRRLYIPINTWFTLDSRCAFPLICNQYNELYINITLRPIQDLFQVRDVLDTTYGQPYIRPDFNQSQFQMYRFLQTPPTIRLLNDDYQNTISTWNADIHLLCTYCFLSKQETEVFAKENQVYLIKDVFEYNFGDIIGTKKLKLLSSNGMVANWMFFLQRNDVNLRNEWSNYTNWPYRDLPSNLIQTTSERGLVSNSYGDLVSWNLSLNPDGSNTRVMITGDFNTDNRREILETVGILLNGEYREKTMVREIFDYVEKYTRTHGFATPGIYCYNFCLDTNPRMYQPSGAINMSKFTNVELEVSTYIPAVKENLGAFSTICDDGQLIGFKKPTHQLYEYTYNLTIMEERYNILSFIGGTCGLMYAR